MKRYEYPKVPPSAQLQRQPDSLAVQAEDDNRFSWVRTPAEAENRMWQNNTQEQADIPPLPQIPDHLNPVKETQRLASVHTLPQLQTQEQALLQHDQKMAHVVASGNVVQPIHPTMVVAEPVQQYTQPEQHTLATNMTPVKEQASQMSVTPDSNPLTPVSPTKAEPRTNNINMAILSPPSDPSQYNIGNFTTTPQPERGGTWQHGFCSCAEPTICMTSLLCPCVVYGKTQYRLELRSEKKDPTNMLGYNWINGSCLVFGVLCGINGILAAIQHTRVRKGYEMEGMAGNVAGDCVKGLCCCCCVVAQDEKEFKFREEEARAAGRPVSNLNDAYTSPGKMTFAAPPR